MTAATGKHEQGQHASGSLVQAIRRKGPLADIFSRASREQFEAASRLVAGRWTRQSARQLVDDARARLLAEVGQSPLALVRQCGAGCSACCETCPVDVTPLEALVLAESIRESFSPDEQTELRQRLRKNTLRARRELARAGHAPRLKCAMLDQRGQCRAYAARPLVCAGIFSLSRKACLNAPPGGGAASIPLDRPAKVFAMGTSGALQRTLVGAGLDGNLYELNSALLRALTLPDAFEKWLSREDVFAGCICTDAHSPPRRQARPRVAGSRKETAA